MTNTEPTVTSSKRRVDCAEGLIPLSVPFIKGNEWRYVKECLDTNWVSSAGPFVNRFERLMADYLGVKYAVATVNGTSALHAALLVSGVQPDDEILMPALTFIAPANTVRYTGAWPVFMDVDPDYWEMDTQKVEDFLKKECVSRRGILYNKKSRRRVKGLLPVHILGHPIDMDALLNLSREYGLSVIEDATESVGAKYKGRKLGSFGDVACLSFNGNKIITTGGGGMVVTNNKRWADKARYLTTQAKDDAVESVHQMIGYNYRLVNLLAAVGCAQMESLDKFISVKRYIAEIYRERLYAIEGIRFMQEAPWAFSTFWMSTIRVDADRFGCDSRRLIKHLLSSHIQTRPLWQPLHQSPAHRQSQSYCVEQTMKIHWEAVSLPSSVGLTKKDQFKVLEAIGRIKKS